MWKRFLWRDIPEPAELLSVSAGQVDDQRRLVMAVSGEVDQYTAPLLSSALRSQCRGGTIHELVVDMEHVSFLGGAGLAALAQVRQECLTRGIRLVVRCNGRRAVIRPLHLAGLSELLATDYAVEESSDACVVHLSDRRAERASRAESKAPMDMEGVGRARPRREQASGELVSQRAAPAEQAPRPDRSSRSSGVFEIGSAWRMAY
jgi:anti-sigma B factor antagonist